MTVKTLDRPLHVEALEDRDLMASINLSISLRDLLTSTPCPPTTSPAHLAIGLSLRSDSPLTVDVDTDLRAGLLRGALVDLAITAIINDQEITANARLQADPGERIGANIHLGEAATTLTAPTARDFSFGRFGRHCWTPVCRR